MAQLQKYFEKFHETIKLSYENDDLRTSRDAIKSKLTSSLKEYLKDKNIPIPIFFDQGSYAIGTGIKPNEEGITYDIDEGVKFDISTSMFSDPVSLKKSVKEALAGHTELGIEIKGPCVRVVYSENKKEKYHVDLAIYATNGQTQRGSVLYLARGKEFSDDSRRYWEKSQPEAIIDMVCGKYSDKNTMAQMRRVIRYLKRWKDVNFFSSGNASPTGIGLTVAAYYFFQPVFDQSGNPDDLTALSKLIGSILANTKTVQSEVGLIKRFQCVLPVEPHNDLFRRMTDRQMEKFLKEVENLNNILDKAANESLEEEACLQLAEVFGDDFPSAEFSKNFALVKKPILGKIYFLQPVSGYDTAPTNISIKGFVYSAKGKRLPINSNKGVLMKGHKLEFRADWGEDQDQTNVYWRVVNTGSHVDQLVAQTKSNPADIYRGKFEVPHILVFKNNKLEMIKSPDKWVNQETTAYTGKHWIECIAIAGGKCVAKSKPFYVNIYNSNFPEYV